MSDEEENKTKENKTKEEAGLRGGGFALGQQPSSTQPTEITRFLTRVLLATRFLCGTHDQVG